MIQRAERAHPTAEEPAQEDRGNQDHQRPQQSLVQCAAGEQRHERGERIELQREGDRVRQPDFGDLGGAEVHLERGLEHQPQEHEEEHRL